MKLAKGVSTGSKISKKVLKILTKTLNRSGRKGKLRLFVSINKYIICFGSLSLLFETVKWTVSLLS